MVGPRLPPQYAARRLTCLEGGSRHERERPSTWLSALRSEDSATSPAPPAARTPCPQYRRSTVSESCVSGTATGGDGAGGSPFVPSQDAASTGAPRTAYARGRIGSHRHDANDERSGDDVLAALRLHEDLVEGRRRERHLDVEQVRRIGNDRSRRGPARVRDRPEPARREASCDLRDRRCCCWYRCRPARHHDRRARPRPGACRGRDERRRVLRTERSRARHSEPVHHVGRGAPAAA